MSDDVTTPISKWTPSTKKRFKNAKIGTLKSSIFWHLWLLKAVITYYVSVFRYIWGCWTQIWHHFFPITFTFFFIDNVKKNFLTKKVVNFWFIINHKPHSAESSKLDQSNFDPTSTTYPKSREVIFLEKKLRGFQFSWNLIMRKGHSIFNLGLVHPYLSFAKLYFACG